MPDSTCGDVGLAPIGESQAATMDCSPESLWKPRSRETVASKLPEGHYLFSSPSTYIFSGAEVYMELDDTESPGASFAEEESESESSRSSFSSDEEDEEEDCEEKSAPVLPRLGSPVASTGNTMDCDAAERPAPSALSADKGDGGPATKTRVSEEEGSSDLERNTVRCS